jgi:hypothetical protein
MFPPFPQTPKGDQPQFFPCRDETLERIGHDLLMSRDSCHLLRLACQIADYGAMTVDREVDTGVTDGPAERSDPMGPSASEPLHD